ncbi:HlyD family secretion protein [Halomonas binhaiensis]|uniref:HlyD family secretion protein n=1 Tax=Halomonas binhaiensis TaxID=2562282 RepID=A0A5C1NK15_9GAMM|nr:HlyD family secretion protein [Halomonas binhaiensis]QEM83021.1 HlyD family secretion protein [Halomonas binhaiensis]
MTTPSSQAASRRLPKASRLALLTLLVLACLIWAGLAIYHRLTHVSAQDARVMADQVTISSRLPGWVTDFTLIEGDTLAKNDMVARLYSQPDERQLEALQAGVAAAQARLNYQNSRLKLSQAQLEGGLNITQQELEASRAAMDAANARLEQARKDYERSNSLLARHSVSQQQRDEDYYALQSAQAESRQATQEVAVSQAQADNAQVGFINGSQMPLPNPDVIRAQLEMATQELAQARSQVAQQQLRLSDLQVPSPIGGIVDKTLIDEGEYISAGQPILMMHNPDALWVEANIKETDVGELRLGQPVDITVDAYPNDDFHGHVAVIGRAATSQFALLPDPNPSGNFTKITQRIPVRIALDDGPFELIGPGMMVEVDIDVTVDGQRHG